MSESLHCNWLQCRKSLSSEAKAVVTTCSHIFCVSCAKELFTADKTCPACKTSLTRPDDVVLSCLNPTPDYRISALAGLSPSVATEILHRSIQFWQYQQTQELAYQTLLLGQAHEKNQQLEARLQAVIKEANNEITLLQSRENQLKASCKALESQNQEFKERLTRLVDEKYAKCTPESAAFAMSDGHRPRHSKFPSNLTIAAQKRSLPSTDSQEMPWQSTSRSFLSDSDDTRRSASAKHSGIPSIPSEHSTSIEDNSMIPTETSLLNTNWEPSKNLSRFSPLSSRDGDTPSLSKTKSRRMSSATSNTFDGSSKSKDSLSWLRNVHKPSSSVPPFPSSSHSRSLNSDAAIHRPNSVLGHISGRASNGGASAYAMDRSHSTQSRLG